MSKILNISIKTQEKTVIPSNERQEIIADEGYSCLSKVVVEGIAEPEKSKLYITEYDSDGSPIKAKTINLTETSQYQFVGYNNGNMILSNLVKIELNEGLTTLARETFFKLWSLTKIVFPSTISLIGTQCFYNCNSNGLIFDFRKAKQVPTLSGTDAFNSTSSTRKIVVPDELYDEWITATNWSSSNYNIVSSIIKASDYESSL